MSLQAIALDPLAMDSAAQGLLATSGANQTQRQMTGIQRGGFYNPFASKEELAIETFKYACSVLVQQLKQAVYRQTTVFGQLKAIATTFANLYTQNPLFPCGRQALGDAGGCQS